MSIRATLEFIAQIHHFFNIDLPSQGTFCLGLSIYKKIGQHKIFANPFELAENNSHQKSKKKIIMPAHATLQHFYSKVAIVKYVDQKIKLNDIIRFKLEIQSFPTLDSDDLFLQIDLHFSSQYPSEETKQFHGKIVSSKIFRIQSIQSGIFTYFEPQFCESFPSKCALTLFGFVSNFKFGKYKLPYIQQITKQLSEGNVVIQQNHKGLDKKPLKQKQQQRLLIDTFDGMMKWIKIYYSAKIPNPLLYFYNTYVKNLRYYFYLIQQKTSHFLTIPQKTVLKVSSEFYQLPTNISDDGHKFEQHSLQTIFRKYMTDFVPQNLTETKIMSQLHEIYSDIYTFMFKMEKQFVYGQIKTFQLIQQYNLYLKQLYGERVFKSIVYTDQNRVQDMSRVNAQQNKKIAKKMRQKKTTSLAQYSVVDMQFINNKKNMQYIFYEITYPASKKLKKQEYMIDNQISIQNQPEIRVDQTEQKVELISQKYQDTLIMGQQEKERKDSFQNDDNFVQKANEVDSEIFGSEISDIQVKNKANQDQENSDNDRISASISDKGQKDISQHFQQEQQQHQSSLQFISKDSQKFINQDFLSKFDQKDMLIVMCHGFQGSSYDTMLIYRVLKTKYPKASFLPSRCNQAETDGDLEDMGKRLSIQITNFVKNYLDEDKVIINMIGHSMGGIISRAALKYLPRKFDKFGFYFSLSSPHLGYLNGVQQKIMAGLWVINKLKPTRSLEQLTMKDSSNPRNSYLYKLSIEGSLKKFRKIILWSSFEDSYVTWHSARIVVHAHKKKSTGIKIEEQMVNNILGSNPIHRLDINFNIKKNNLDGLIGRAAHINLIVQESLFKIVSATIPDLFDVRKLS